MIQSSGEYSLEVWAGTGERRSDRRLHHQLLAAATPRRDATLGQDAMQYEGRARSSSTDTNGASPLMTTTRERCGPGGRCSIWCSPTIRFKTARRSTSTGSWTGDADPAKGGSLANWTAPFALVLGNETTAAAERAFQRAPV